MRELLGLLLSAVFLHGCEADGPIWMPPFKRADALFRFVNHNRAGFINAAGEIVVPANLPVESNWSQAFYDGLLALNISEPEFLDRRGKKKIFSGLGWVSGFSEGLAQAGQSRNSSWGYIDQAGQFVVPPIIPWDADGGPFSDGLATLEVAGKVGYIDRSGKYAITPQFIAGSEFEDGIARVVTKGPCFYFDSEAFDPCMQMSPRVAPRSRALRHEFPPSSCKWSFIDRTGKRIIDTEFDSTMGFREGLAAVKLGELWGFVNRSGVLVIPPTFRSVHSFSDGLALVEDGQKSGFIDKTGNLVIPANYYKTEPFSEGLTAVGDTDTGYTYIDVRGKQVIPERFSIASRFHHGLAHVKLWDPKLISIHEGRFAYINKIGKHIFSYQR